MTSTATQAPPAEEKGVLPFPSSKPGEQGSATHDDGPTVQTYEPAEPTQQEIKLAQEVLDELENRAKMSDEGIILGLIQIVDKHPKFTTGELFGGKGEDREIYEPASVPAEIARLLCRCTKIDVSYSKVAFWFKDHEKWTSAGVTVDAQVKRYDGFHQHINDGMLAAILFNYHHWKTLNPRQKVFTVYHALRQIDGEGKRAAPDWVGFYDEPALFGAGVHREMVTMARAFTKDAAQHAGEPYQLSILDEVYDGQG